MSRRVSACLRPTTQKGEETSSGKTKNYLLGIKD